MKIYKYEINFYKDLTDWQREYFQDCIRTFCEEDFGLRSDEFECIETEMPALARSVNM